MPLKKIFKIETKNRNIKTSIPAPGTEKILKKLKSIESRSMHGQLPIVWKKAKNFNIYDMAGNKFIDFTSTIFVANIGLSKILPEDVLSERIIIESHHERFPQ